MPSAALEELNVALSEVIDLQRANPTPPGGLPDKPKVVRAINRASVVLLYSHFERYLRRVNEEALDLLNEQEVESHKVPEAIRLEHSSVPVDSMAPMQWPNRAKQLSEFVAQDAWLWGEAPRAQLDAARLLRWFVSPTQSESADSTDFGTSRIYLGRLRGDSTGTVIYNSRSQNLSKSVGISHMAISRRKQHAKT